MPLRKEILPQKNLRSPRQILSIVAFIFTLQKCHVLNVPFSGFVDSDHFITTITRAVTAITKVTTTAVNLRSWRCLPPQKFSRAPFSALCGNCPLRLLSCWMFSVPNSLCCYSFSCCLPYDVFVLFNVNSCRRLQLEVYPILSGTLGVLYITVKYGTM